MKAREKLGKPHVSKSRRARVLFYSGLITKEVNFFDITSLELCFALVTFLAWSFVLLWSYSCLEFSFTLSNSWDGTQLQ